MDIGPEALVSGVLILLATVAFVMRVRQLEKKLDVALNRLHETSKQKRDDPPPWKKLQESIESLQTRMDAFPREMDRVIAVRLSTRPQPEAPAPPRSAPPVVYDEPRATAEDGVAQLLTIANGIVQDSSTTLETFRTRTDRLGARVTTWPPNAADPFPIAFIVEHRGSCYAVPNVVKPARLPQEWFNRSTFGVNDEIRRVVTLPRLRRSAQGFDVQEPGVFER